MLPAKTWSKRLSLAFWNNAVQNALPSGRSQTAPSLTWRKPIVHARSPRTAATSPTPWNLIPFCAVTLSRGNSRIPHRWTLRTGAPPSPFRRVRSSRCPQIKIYRRTLRTATPPPRRDRIPYGPRYQTPRAPLASTFGIQAHGVTAWIAPGGIGSNMVPGIGSGVVAPGNGKHVNHHQGLRQMG